MKKTSKRGHSTMSELNITPLLDLVFVLLVIFIITTPQMVNSLEMALPSGKPPPPNPNAPKPIIHDPCVLIQIRNKTGSSQTARCFPCRKSSSATSVRISCQCSLT